MLLSCLFYSIATYKETALYQNLHHILGIAIHTRTRKSAGLPMLWSDLGRPTMVDLVDLQGQTRKVDSQECVSGRTREADQMFWADLGRLILFLLVQKRLLRSCTNSKVSLVSPKVSLGLPVDPGGPSWLGALSRPFYLWTGWMNECYNDIYSALIRMLQHLCQS